MRWTYKLRLRLRSLLRKPRVEQELTEELRFHLEKLIEEKVGKGMTAEEARYAALRELGGVEQIKEECREMRRVNYIGDFFQDVRYGLRMLAKNPGFTVVAVLTLALGIASNSTIFSAVSAVLLRKPPVEDPDRVMMVLSINQTEGWDNPEKPTSAPDFLAWRDQNHVFEEMAAVSPWQNLNLTGQGEPVLVAAMSTSAEYFGLLGVSPERGRTFLPGEDRPSASRVAIISHRLWETHFGSEPNLLGKPMKLNDQSYTIVGIMPASFKLWAFAADVWTPLVFNSKQLGPEGRASRSLYVFARLKAGVTAKAGQAEMATIARRLEQSYSATEKGWTATVVPLQEFLILDAHARPALLILMGAVGLVLAIACANIAGLLLARGTTRRREIAIRLALGAGWLRVVRQLLSESLLIGLMGAALGLLASRWAIKLLRATLNFNDVVSSWECRIDGRVLIFVVIISVATVLLFGLVPAFQASKTNPQEALKEGGRGGGPGRHRSRVRRVLITGEIALALLLLSGAGLMIAGFVESLRVYPGFNPQHLLTARITLPASRYPSSLQQAAFFQQATERIEHIPGVVSATVTDSLPLAAEAGTVPFKIERQPPGARPTEQPQARLYVVRPGYFRTMQIAVMGGRAFTGSDDSKRPGVAVVNEAFVRRFFPKGEVIGKRIKVELEGSAEQGWREIAGVVGNVKDWIGQPNNDPQIYECYLQSPSETMTLVVRTESDPVALVPDVRRAVWSVDKDQPLDSLMTMAQVIDARGEAGDRIMSELLGVFASLALILAAVGIYGVIAYAVTERTHEMGIRVALGAQNHHVLKLVLREGGTLTAVGLALGFVGAYPLPRLFAGIFSGFSADSALVLAGAPVLIAVVALAATYIPARRATKVDPIVALRYE